MLGKLLPKLSFFVLIAILIVLFNFSLTRIEDYFISDKAFKVSQTISEKINISLNERDKNIWRALPCKQGARCNDVSDIKGKIESAITNPYIKRSLILDSKGVEVFSGRTIDAKYNVLINDALKLTKAYSIERTKTSTKKENKLITVYKIQGGDKLVLSLFDYDKISIKRIIIAYFAGTLVLVSIIAIYFFRRETSFESTKVKLDEENKNYITQIEDLRKENVQQSQFLANFTHELRTPLNSIIGFSGLIKDQTLGPLGNQEYVKYATDINTSGVHLLSLINDILDYSKSEVGKLKVNMTEVDVIKVIKQSLSIIAPRASESNVDLMQSFANDYFIIRLDPKRFKQIMLNLLSNSVKFTPEGGSVMVSVFPDLKGEKVSIEVKDTGVGIAEKDIPTVMSLFGQVETDLNRKYEGTGIGLPFAKKLTAIMGGVFDLQSKVGVGTRITLTFPYDKKLNAEYEELYKKNSSETL